MNSNPAENHSSNRLFLFIGIMLVASVLRTPITGVGPLLDAIQLDLGLSAGMAGLLTALPVFIFAGMSPIVHLAGRIGVERSLMLALLLVGVGSLVRSFGLVSTLFAGTILLSVGIAVGNVLLPTVVKRDFPQRATLITTTYITWMGTLASVASGIAVPLAAWLALLLSGEGAPLHWQGSLAIWAVTGLAAALILWPQTRTKNQSPPQVEEREAVQASVLKSPVAWQITTFMGLQAMGFYVLIAWLAVILHDSGYSAEGGGWLMAFYQLVGLISGLLLPFLVSRCKDQRALTAVCSLLCGAGAFGLYAAPGLAAVWLFLAGFGSGCCFILAMAFISLRSGNHRQATSLSVMVNGGGYFIAALGPLFFGWLHEQTQSWDFLLLGLTAVGIVQAVLGWLAGRDKIIDD